GAVNLFEDFLVGNLLVFVVDGDFAAATLCNVFINKGRGGIIKVWEIDFHERWTERSGQDPSHCWLFASDNLALHIGGDDDRFRIGIMLNCFIAVLFAKTALFNAPKRQLVINDLR